MTVHTFWSLLRLAEEILLLDLPSSAFSFVACSWSSKPYILQFIYPRTTKRPQIRPKAQHIFLGPLIPTFMINLANLRRLVIEIEFHSLLILDFGCWYCFRKIIFFKKIIMIIYLYIYIYIYVSQSWFSNVGENGLLPLF